MLNTKAIVTIKNVPADPEKYIVARFVSGDLWYWGSFAEDEKNRAERARDEIDGLICEYCGGDL